MGKLLKQQKRDILYNLCQYGEGKVWEWGAEVGGQSWRTAGDLGHTKDKIYEVALENAKHRAYSKPGAWNDPDYLIIGNIGLGEGKVAPCALSPNEQYAYMSMWCLMASPLFFSGDMNTLDDFTLNVLCNAEVIEVDQDPLGECAEVVKLSPKTFLMVKKLEDGGRAVGLFNRDTEDAKITAKWSDIGSHRQAGRPRSVAAEGLGRVRRRIHRYRRPPRRRNDPPGAANAGRRRNGGRLHADVQRPRPDRLGRRAGVLVGRGRGNHRQEHCRETAQSPVLPILERRQSGRF